MKEPLPFHLVGRLGDAEHAGILAEVRSQENRWGISGAAGGGYKRRSLVVTRSPYWVSGPGVTAAKERAVGTFGFVPALKDRIPVIRGLIGRLQDVFQAADFGSVYVSRMAPGGRVGSHRDNGPYYRQYHRCQVCLQAEPETIFMCDGERLVMRPGEIWVFDNTRMHSVEHDGEQERIALVVDVRGANC